MAAPELVGMLFSVCRRAQATAAFLVCSVARGRLAHRVELAGERIRDYRLLAPTDWNFGPNERLSGALAGMPAPDSETARQRAGLALLALDPCVPAVVTVE